MKLELLFLFIVICFPHSFTSAQWEWQYPVPQGNTLNDVFFLNQNSGWAVGDAGTIIKSNYAGSYFDVINYPFYNDLFAVEFFNENQGIAVGDSGAILITSDGGSCWNRIQAGLAETLKDICIIQPNNAWITGEKGKILYSANYGETWNIQFSDTSVCLSSVCFIDHVNGWAAGRNNSEGKVLLRTDNGGENWTEISDGSFPPFRVVQFIDISNGFAITAEGDASSNIINTTDGGLSWIHLGGFIDVLSDLFFADTEHGWGVGMVFTVPINSWRVACTFDGGITWDCGEFIWHGGGLRGGLNSVFFTDINNGWIVGWHGNILKINKLGDYYHWTIISRGNDIPIVLRDIIFTDESNGWVVGGSEYPAYSKILYTENGGSNWEEITLPFDYIGYLKNVFFIDQNEGWLVGGANDWSTNMIFHTTDNGLSWETQVIQAFCMEYSINDICFNDSENGWAVGICTDDQPNTGIILQTINGGVNWYDLLSTDKRLSAIHFINQDNGWIVGDKIILHTSDGGQHWDINRMDGYYWSDLFFTDDNHGWIIGLHHRPGPSIDVIMRTVNGGADWDFHLFDNSSKYIKLFFTDNYHGWLVRDWQVYYSVDGGITWEEEFINSTCRFAGIFFLGKDNGWIVGENSSIVHTDQGGLVGGKEQPFITQDQQLYVRSYPNPSSGQIIFNFNLDEPSEIRLSFLNNVGQVVGVMDRSLPQGEQQVVWDAEGMPAGLYFYRFTVNEQQPANGKLVVVR